MRCGRGCRSRSCDGGKARALRRHDGTSSTAGVRVESVAEAAGSRERSPTADAAAAALRGPARVAAERHVVGWAGPEVGSESRRWPECDAGSRPGRQPSRRPMWWVAARVRARPDGRYEPCLPAVNQWRRGSNGSTRPTDSPCFRYWRRGRRARFARRAARRDRDGGSGRPTRARACGGGRDDSRASRSARRGCACRG